MKPSYGKKIISIIFLLVAVLVWWPHIAGADDAVDVKPSDVQTFKADDAADADPSSIKKIKECFFGDLRILTYGVIQQPANSSQNPDNNFLQLPHYTADLEIRPDLLLDLDFLRISAKPRAKLEFLIWEEGLSSGETQWKDEWYVNEWLVRLRAWENIFVSYGRENLQWGPSFLFSPSNPFFSDNGRRNPYMEIPGMDFGRLVFIPHSLWTISLIVNTDEGRNKVIGLESFEKTYAIKIDYMGGENYASLILSQKDYNETLGFYGGWTVSDAVLIYGEGNLTKGTSFPEEDTSLGALIKKIYGNDSDNIRPIILIGGSYTFEGSGTFSLEYAYNNPGLNSEEANLYYLLRGGSALAFDMGGIAGLLGEYGLSKTINPGLRLLRKNYAMLQYSQGNIKDKLDLTLRWTQNFDDGSAQFLALLSCSLGNHWELFSSGVINAGGNNTEFGSLLDYQLMFGIKFTL